MRKFRPLYNCEKCGIELTRKEVYNSDGCCPYCGKISNDPTVSDHIVDHYKTSVLIEEPKLPKLLENLIKTTRNFYSKEGK